MAELRRDPFFDGCKFVAIILVVYSHVSATFKCEAGQPFVSNFIVGMNMPVFFIISGYFLSRTIEKGEWLKLGKRLLGYFWPLVSVSFVFAVSALFLHLPGYENGIIGYAGRNVLFGAWFIWCLAICFTVMFILYRLRSVRLRICGGLILFVALLLARGVLYIGYVRSMLPFFIFGMIVLRTKRLWCNMRIGLPCLFAYLLVAIFEGEIRKNGLSFYDMKTDVFSLMEDWRNPLFFICRIINGIIGSLGVMWAIQNLLRHLRFLKKASVFGVTTLWVYILHQWVIHLWVIYGFTNPTLGFTVLSTIILFLACHMAGLFVKRIQSRLQELLAGCRAGVGFL